MVFYTPPMEAGTYPVRIGYGGLDEDPVGYFTYYSSDEILGHGSCRSDTQCNISLESCELAGTRDHRPLRQVAVPRHLATAGVVTVISVALDEPLDLVLECPGEHPPSTLRG